MRTTKNFLGKAKLFLLELTAFIILAMALVKIVLVEWRTLFP